MSSIFYIVLIPLDNYIISFLLFSCSFQGIQVPLSGLQTLKVHAPQGGEEKNYNVRASGHGTSALYLLTGDKSSSESLVVSPPFSGLLTVGESYGDKSGNQPLQVIPTAPAPSIPPWLTHRFPLLSRTSSTQTCSVKNEPEELAKHPTDETREEEELRKKKKRKKEKKIKLEQEEETDTLGVNEIVPEIPDEVKPFQEGGVLEEKKRKKKRKKRDCEREETEQAVEEGVVKCEPEDSWNNDASEVSKKKKKKKRKIDGD